MNKKMKTGLLLLTAIMVTSSVLAQTLEDGKKFFFYEKYTSAKNMFNKLLSINPNNIDAIYWLGQTELAMEDSATATKLYRSASIAHPGDPLLFAGLGHIELLAGQTEDARQTFETAISLSKGRSIPVLDAIGFANVKAPAGDANYAIGKLQQATTIKGFKDADVYINMGDAYMKTMDGGAAQTAYQNAADLDKSSPIPSYKLGKLYETQGPAQEEIFISDYDDAIGKDPTFGPVYYALYSYYYHRDVNKSRDYLENYINNSDPDPKDCYYEASILFASALYQPSIDKADDCIAADTSHPYPNLFGLKAYDYYSLGLPVEDQANDLQKIADSTHTPADKAVAKKYQDSALHYFKAARASFDDYFAKQKPAKIGPGDYSTRAKILLKFPGTDSLASVYIDKAIALDTLEADKINEAKILIDYYTSTGNSNGIGNAFKKVIAARSSPVNSDYQSAGFYFYRAGNYTASSAIFDSATTYFPNDVYDYYMLGKSLSVIDSTMKGGLANPAFAKVEQLGTADTVNYKAQLIGVYQYFVEYYINIKKDKDTALAYCDKILALDPTNAETIKNRDIISKLKVKTAADK
jgi:tetratricopeptide (TPR) repeat protein